MEWSHWRGAVALALLGWSGFAWTQNPAPSPTTVSGERVMVVNEGGRSVRCRIVSTWELPDGKTAHQLQALDSGEMITIVDDIVPAPHLNPAQMPKRIFRWGLSRNTPPVGVPVPPAPSAVPAELKVDSGVVLNHVAPPPAGMQTVMIDGKATTIVGNPTIITQSCESCDKNVLTAGNPQNGPTIIQEGTIIVSETPAPIKPAWNIGEKLFGKKTTEIRQVATTPAPSTGAIPYSSAADRSQIPAATVPDTNKPQPKSLAINDSSLPPLSRKEEAKSSFSVLEQATKKGDVVKLPTPAKTTSPALAPQGDWPLGSQSVLASKSGLQGPVTYVPVPLVTVPNPIHPPTPPAPKLPDGPQLNAFVNAFTPPVPREAMEKQQQAMMMQQGILPPTQGMMMPPQQGYAMNPYQMQQAMMQQQMIQQQMMQQQMMRQPVAISPYRQATPLNYAARYNGPQAPNPLVGAQPVAPAGFYPPMMQMPPQGMPLQGMVPPMMPVAPQGMPMQPIQPVTFQQPTPSAPTAASELVSQWIKLLKESPFPGQREQAAHTLATHDWRTNPQVLTALIDAAQHDPAVSVRVGCVYALGRTSAATETVFSALQSLRSDSEERVRQEVDTTLSRLQRGQSSASAN